MNESLGIPNIDTFMPGIEIKGQGGVIVVEPSIHPTGEKLTWDGLLLSPAEIDAGHLVAAVRLAWTARLIAKYWPARGRHELRLAYARVLLETIGMPSDVAIKVLEWACRLGGSDAHGIADVRRAIDDTRRRLAEHEPAVGGRTVAAHLPEVGRRIVQLLRKAYGKTDVLLVEVKPAP